MAIKLFNTTIGLALGGGAAKGVAHVGVLKALEDANVDIEYIAGTSVGAMLAALYAFNVSIETIGELSRRLTLSKVTTFKLNKTGFFSTNSLKELMLEYLGDVNIEDAKIPLAIVATDINSGEEVILTSGSVADAVCASAAIPGIYIPFFFLLEMLPPLQFIQVLKLRPLRFSLQVGHCGMTRGSAQVLSTKKDRLSKHYLKRRPCLQKLVGTSVT